ncbi:peptidylprolyl isomerase [Rhodobacter capsulatus]|uniref:peptidylprolyl isomerase n=1 Tax=Rhodobacter capsulatus TaxID=1061 RepID=UPI0009C17914|nr:peptidylprolyl isomerase [Rhodobacter capsulatus]
MTERMMRHFPSLLGWVLTAGLALGTAAPLQAQATGDFAPAITVNGLAISGYEIAQRARFMELLGATGDVRKMAEEALIDDRLQGWKAQSLGISVSREAVTRGMAEFAARANLSTEDFLKALAGAGVEAQTYRDFVTSGVIWREVVKTTYGGGRIQISDAEIDRALAHEAPKGAEPEPPKVLISEIVIRNFPGRDAETMAKARKAAAAKTEAEFAALAKELSSSKSAGQGGRLDWMPVTALPPEVRETVLGLRPGRASAPVETPNSVSVFFLRGLDEGAPLTPQTVAQGYATLLLGASGSPEAAGWRAKAEADAQRCDDLYSVAAQLPPERLERVEAARAGQIPADIARVLPRMDIGEMTVLTRGGNDVLVMLCDRGRAINAAVGETGPSREGTRDQLLNARVGALADRLLAQLRAEAVIVRK